MTCEPPQTVNDVFACFAVSNMSWLAPILVLVALITFFSGVLKYVKAGDNEEQRQAGRQVIIFGIIVLFVMMSFWGFVNILSNSFFGRNATLPDYIPIKK